MRAIITAGFGRSTRLVVGQRPSPTPGDEDVLVQVQAASVNPKDWKLNYHAAVLAAPLGSRLLPPLFGDDLAGIVIAKGAQVQDFAIGDSIYGMDMRPRTASLAEQAIISQQRIARMPSTLSFAQAAAVPLAALTALQGLRLARLPPQADVLIIGASGGVGCFAVQIAKALGHRVTAVCSHRNITLVRRLGADAVLDYTAGDFRITADRFDLVFDVTSYETPNRCRDLLKASGLFVSTGGSASAVVGTLLARGSWARTVRVESYRADLETLTGMIDDGLVQVVIDSQFALSNSQQAYDRSRSGRARGKIVITVAD